MVETLDKVLLNLLIQSLLFLENKEISDIDYVLLIDNIIACSNQYIKITYLSNSINYTKFNYHMISKEKDKIKYINDDIHLVKYLKQHSTINIYNLLNFIIKKFFKKGYIPDSTYKTTIKDIHKSNKLDTDLTKIKNPFYKKNIKYSVDIKNMIDKISYIYIHSNNFYDGIKRLSEKNKSIELLNKNDLIKHVFEKINFKFVENIRT